MMNRDYASALAAVVKEGFWNGASIYRISRKPTSEVIVAA